MVNLGNILAEAGANQPASEAAVRACNLKLRQHNLPEIPESFCEVLKICNGVTNDGSLVFGVEIRNNNWFKDIALFNIAYFKGESADWLILGEDDFFFLVYDSSEKKYFVVDRDTLEGFMDGEDVVPLLECLLKIEA